jgi:hypothetical protein
MTLRTSARRPRGTARFAALVLTASILAGCSPGSKSPTTTTTTKLTGFAAEPASTILADACAATYGARSMTATTLYGRPSQVGNIVSMRWVVTVGTTAGTVLYLHHGVVHAIIMPTISYLKGNAAYWTNDASPPRPGATSLENKWLSVASSSANNSVMAALIAQASLQSVLVNCVPTTPPLKGTLSTVGSTQEISVKVTSGTTTQTFFVPTSGTPYVVRTTIEGPASGKRTTYLGGFNHQKLPTAPPGATPIDPLLAS